MVQNVLKAVYREVKGLHEAAYVLAVFTFGSQILALIRDRLLAHQFGADIELDLYYAAFRIPDILYVLFASMLSVYVLIPFVADRIEGADSSKARRLLSQIFSIFLVSYVVLAGLVAIFAGQIVTLLFPGFLEHQAELTLLMRVLLLQPFLLGISSLFGVITQFQQRFVLFALSPLIYNVGIILGLIFLYPTIGLSGLAIGVVLGALGHLAIQVPYVIRNELAPKIVSKFDFKEIREVLIVSVPRALTLSLHQFVLLGLVGFASIMTVGSVSVFQFAFNLQSVPLATIGVSYSIAAFPLLAKLHAEGNMELFGYHIMTAIRHIVFWSLPVIALMVVVRAQFVRVIFGTGAFDWDDTRLTAAVLAVFVLSLAAQAIHLLVVRALYARGNTRLPFYVTLFSSIGALLISFVLYLSMVSYPALQGFFSLIMRLEDVPGTEVLALPLGYSIALVFHTLALLILSRRQLSIHLRPLLGHFLKSLTAALVAGGFAYVMLNIVVEGLRTETLIGIFLQGLTAGIAGIIGAAFIYYLFKSPELSEIYSSLHQKIFKTDMVLPQGEENTNV